MQRVRPLFMAYPTAHPQPPGDAWVSAAILRAVQSALLEQGIAPEEHGLLPALPSAPESRVPWSECVRRLSIGLQLSPDPALGLMAGARATVAALHVVGHVLISCQSLRQAIETFMRFSPLVIQGARFALREEGERAAFAFTAPSCDEVAQRFCAELALSLAFGVARTFPAPHRELPRLLWASFRHAEPAYAERYEQVFGCTVRFGAHEDALIFPRAFLDVRYVYADDTLRDLLARRAELLLCEQGDSVSLSLRVKTHLRSCDLDCFDAARVARAVGVSHSALRRRLSQEGTTFSALVDDVRRELALSALRDPTVCIKVLSEQLGFSEPCAFHRAFRRWTGTTPARYREDMRSAVCA
jgi:AraC-like DNA-binding protein